VIPTIKAFNKNPWVYAKLFNMYTPIEINNFNKINCYLTGSFKEKSRIWNFELEIIKREVKRKAQEINRDKKSTLI